MLRYRLQIELAVSWIFGDATPKDREAPVVLEPIPIVVDPLIHCPRVRFDRLRVSGERVLRPATGTATVVLDDVPLRAEHFQEQAVVRRRDGRETRVKI